VLVTSEVMDVADQSRLPLPHTHCTVPLPSTHPGWLATDAHRACQPAAPVLLQFLPQQAASL
jgi:hypothetical protein